MKSTVVDPALVAVGPWWQAGTVAVAAAETDPSGQFGAVAFVFAGARQMPPDPLLKAPKPLRALRRRGVSSLLHPSYFGNIIHPPGHVIPTIYSDEARGKMVSLSGVESRARRVIDTCQGSH